MNKLARARQLHTQEIVLVLPILPGKSEAWRRFIQEIQGSRRSDYEASRRRLGMFAERTWISTTAQGEQAIIIIEVEDPEQSLRELSNSETPFDVWFRQQIIKLNGVDLRQALSKLLPDRVSAWQVSKSRSQNSIK